MIYADIPKASLDAILGETYEGGTYTLQDELNSLGEDIVHTNFYTLSGSGNASDLNGLVVYTPTYVGVIVHNIFGDLCLIRIKRNP